MKYLLFVLEQITEAPRCWRDSIPNGRCVDIRQCKKVLKILREFPGDPEVANYLRNLQCGIKGQIPLVCCKAIDLDNRFAESSESTTMLSTIITKSTNFRFKRLELVKVTFNNWCLKFCDAYMFYLLVKV